MMERRAKIVCTLGPSSSTPERVGMLIDEGMDVARLNFSHGDFSHHAEVLCCIRDAARETTNQTFSDAAYASPPIRFVRRRFHRTLAFIQLKSVVLQELYNDCTSDVTYSGRLGD